MIAMRPIAIAGHCRHVRAFYLSNARGVRGLWAYFHMHQCLYQDSVIMTDRPSPEGRST
jgi:hypothetical protein